MGDILISLHNLTSLVIQPVWVILFLLSGRKSETLHSFLRLGYLFFTIQWIENIIFYSVNFDSLNFSGSVVIALLGARLYALSLKDKTDEIIQRSLIYIAKVAGVAGGVLYFLSNVPFLRGLSTFITAVASSLLLNIIGIHTYPSGIDYQSAGFYLPNIHSVSDVLVPMKGTGVVIVFECSGFREMVVMGTASIVDKTADHRSRMKAFLWGVVGVFAVNVIRNVIVIGSFSKGSTDFETAHGIYGNVFVMIFLTAILVRTMFLLPSLAKSLEVMWGFKKRYGSLQ